ncbi:MAG: membrane protein insertion efficiency factor YidD [Candidatus Aminicenantes bacterium]|nr:membrane protein insertion efficiency factor YidD [Candidatus Aminicenantes bacterium]
MWLRSEKKNNPGFLSGLSFRFIRGYQKIAPRRIRKACRFTPTCSEYAIAAITKYGFLTGWQKTFQRLNRCRPPHSGIDFP